MNDDCKRLLLSANTSFSDRFFRLQKNATQVDPRCALINSERFETVQMTFIFRELLHYLWKPIFWMNLLDLMNSFLMYTF